MPQVKVEVALSNPPPTHPAQVPVLRIRFSASASPDDDVRRQFGEPFPAYAIAESPNSAAATPADLEVASGALPGGAASWMSAGDDIDASSPTIAVKLERARIHWRPSRAVVEAPPDVAPGLIDALLEFAYLEGELRRLEAALAPLERGAQADIPLAFRVKRRHHRHWQRLLRTMETLAGLRLTFARLEPRFGGAPRMLPPDARRLFSRLLVKSGVEERLEALNDRLEACEDLYEGAVDRITDFRWYSKGTLLEVAIVALLALEIALIVYECFG